MTQELPNSTLRLRHGEYTSNLVLACWHGSCGIQHACCPEASQVSCTASRNKDAGAEYWRGQQIVMTACNMLGCHLSAPLRRCWHPQMR